MSLLPVQTRVPFRIFCFQNLNFSSAPKSPQFCAQSHRKSRSCKVSRCTKWPRFLKISLKFPKFSFFRLEGEIYRPKSYFRRSAVLCWCARRSQGILQSLSRSPSRHRDSHWTFQPFGFVQPLFGLYRTAVKLLLRPLDSDSMAAACPSLHVARYKLLIQSFLRKRITKKPTGDCFPLKPSQPLLQLGFIE